MKSNNLRKTYIKYLLPTIGSMILFSTYSMVDGIFVGRGVGAEALSAVNISMPFVSLIFAVAILISIGCSNLITFELGRKNEKEAYKFFSIGISLGAGIGILISLLSTLNIRNLAYVLGARGELIDLVVDYLGVIVLFAGFYILTYMFEIMVKADGEPRLAIIFMIVSALTNIILDYVFIFVFNFGLAGAAWATGISQLIPCVFYFLYFLSKNSKLKFIKFKFSIKELGKILTYGIPASLTELSTGVTISIFNITISKYYGIEGIAAFSLIVYVLNLVINTMIAINQSSQPLVTYNLGLGNLINVKRIRNKQFITIVVLAIIFFLVAQIAPESIVKIFLDKIDKNFLNFTVKAMRLFSISFLVIGFNIGIGGFLTSIKKPKYEFIISILRGYVLVFLSVELLPMIFDRRFIWIALLISELLTLSISLTLLKRSELKA
ncbi:MATE family efflux transporter [Peptoniphilus sp. MSJ-1]|uniref:Multidrug export protein MepA n=1 Tax=Peptoniphilus ovalis TaxID=2841503 RepID=A0ABS6FGW2_9FIRM|nr:MATE family efflux transporter [Peptoniphilus ovalis]MBU5669214.1 MATE family efflux transporter [Peptoniphilus ovalis]